MGESVIADEKVEMDSLKQQVEALKEKTKAAR